MDDMKTVVIAGGAGFLGSHLCDAILAEGSRVLCLDNFLTGSRGNVVALENNRRFRLVEHDICESIEIDEPVDEIYNLACAASPPRYQADPVHTMMTSVVGTHNLLTLAQRHGATLVQASTSEVYGDPLEHPQREDYRGHVNCTGPRACYDEGKRAAEAICFDFLRAGWTDTRVARIFNTYGPRMQPDDGRIISTLVDQALAGRPMTVYGSGEQTRSFCYVSDLVSGMVRLARVHPTPAGPVNLGNPGEYSMNEIAAIVARETGSKAGIRYMPLPEDDPRKRRPDIARAAALLGWRPTVPLEKGLRRTIDWFELIGGGPAGPRQAEPAKSLTA